jgi:hypothetical protein
LKIQLAQSPPPPESKNRVTPCFTLLSFSKTPKGGRYGAGIFSGSTKNQTKFSFFRGLFEGAKLSRSKSLLGRRGSVVYSIFRGKEDGLWHEIPVMSGLLATHNGVMAHGVIYHVKLPGSVYGTSGVYRRMRPVYGRGKKNCCY